MCSTYEKINIKYKKGFVAFIDVLGFKQMIRDKDLTKVNEYFNIVKKTIEDLKAIDHKSKIDSIVISDSVILTVNYDEGKAEKLRKLKHFCIAIGLIQQKLAVKGIWMRGGISFGDVYFKKNQIVGPAYIDACQLEKQYAINPRVILDSELISELGYKDASKLINDININKSKSSVLKYRNWGSRILSEWTESVAEIPQDSSLFIDYLCPLIEKEQNSFNEIQDSVDEILNNNQKNMYLDSRIISKYRWVANYMKALQGKLTKEQQRKLKK